MKEVFAGPGFLGQNPEGHESLFVCSVRLWTHLQQRGASQRYDSGFDAAQVPERSRTSVYAAHIMPPSAVPTWLPCGSARGEAINMRLHPQREGPHLLTKSETSG